MNAQHKSSFCKFVKGVVGWVTKSNRNVETRSHVTLKLSNNNSFPVLFPSGLYKHLENQGEIKAFLNASEIKCKRDN